MSDPQDELPAGMWFYVFMFGDKKPLVSHYVAEGRVPAPSSLVLGMGVGVLLTAARLLLDLVVFKPLARAVLGFPVSATTEATSVPVLDAIFSKSKTVTADDVAKATASTGYSAEEVQGYARARRELFLQNKQINKFKEAAWRLVVYTGLVTLAVKLSYGQPWFEDPFLVWKNWPVGDHGEGLEMYYHIAMGVYWHFIVFQLWDTRRSDFWQMFVHHVATLFLLSYSWLVSLVRIGVLVMLVHDVSDIFMETAKLFNYAQKRFHWCHLMADGVFFVFAGVFGFSRLYIYPQYMVYNTWQAEELSMVSRRFFCSLLSTLLVLHVFWMYLILRMVYMFIFRGVEEDIRSDNGDAAEEHAAGETAPSSTTANGHANGHTNGKSKTS